MQTARADRAHRAALARRGARSAVPRGGGRARRRPGLPRVGRRRRASDLDGGQVALALQPDLAVARTLLGQQHVHELPGLRRIVDVQAQQAPGVRVQGRLAQLPQLPQAEGDLLTLRGPASVSIPTPILALVIVVLAGSLLLRRTWIGRFTELLGENPVAARFAAIDVRWLTFGLYTACGAVCGVAALFHTALYASAKADTAMGMELEAIACVVVGGTRISGGKGSVLGTLLGLLIIGILRYGLEMAGVKSVYVVILVGILLVTTAVFNEWAAARESQ